MRSLLLGALLLAGCAVHPQPHTVYDFDSVQLLAPASVRLHTTVAIPPVRSPLWLRSPALLYRLSYARPSHLDRYALSEWAAPPAELVTLRLRQVVASANDGFTLADLGREKEGVRLELTLEQFVQVFSSPRNSQGVVRISATLTGRGGEVLAQRVVRGEQTATSGDAAGAAQALVQATDACLLQILNWMQQTLEEDDEPQEEVRPERMQRDAALRHPAG